MCISLLFFFRGNVGVQQLVHLKSGYYLSELRCETMSRILTPEAVQPVNQNQDWEIFGDSSSRIRMTSKYKKKGTRENEDPILTFKFSRRLFGCPMNGQILVISHSYATQQHQPGAFRVWLRDIVRHIVLRWDLEKLQNPSMDAARFHHVILWQTSSLRTGTSPFLICKSTVTGPLSIAM